MSYIETCSDFYSEKISILLHLQKKEIIYTECVNRKQTEKSVNLVGFNRLSYSYTYTLSSALEKG